MRGSKSAVKATRRRAARVRDGAREGDVEPARWTRGRKEGVNDYGS